MAKNKKQIELETLSQFKTWFDRIDKAIKLLAVIVFGVSLASYVATLIAGFLHLIGFISHYESGIIGAISVWTLSIGLVGTEFSAVYGVVYEVIQTSRSTKEETKENTRRFWSLLGIHSFVEFSMFFMAFITGVANFLYTLSIIKEKLNAGTMTDYIDSVDILGYNPLKDYLQIDPVHLLAALLFSTIIPIIMIVQSKMQIQFLRFILKTVTNLRNAETKIQGEISKEREEKEKKKKITEIVSPERPVRKTQEFDPFNPPNRMQLPSKD